MRLPKKYVLAALLIASGFFTLLLGQPAQAQPEQPVSSIVPADYFLYVPCRGSDVVQLNGTMHFTWKITQTGNGDSHLVTTSNFQNVTAFNETTGESYRFVGTTKSVEINGGAPYSYTVVYTGAALTPGGGFVFRMHLVSFVTVDEQGNLTTKFLREAWSCDIDDEEPQ